MNITVTVKSNKLPGASAAARRGISRALQANRAPVLADMQRRTPVDTGQLRNSESVDVTETTMTARAGAPHAIYVHQGTRRMGARPFLRTAMEAAAPTIATEIQSNVTSEMSA